MTLTVFLQWKNFSICAVIAFLCINFCEDLAEVRGAYYVPHCGLDVSKLGHPCRALLNIAPVLSQSQQCWFFYSFFAVHLPIVCVGRRKDSAALLLVKYPQCRFKNTRSSDLEAMRLTITVSVLDPSTHFPSIFINARLSQVFKSPTPAIAFVRFASLPRRFTPLSAVTAFSILLSFIEQTGFNKFDFAKIHSFVHICSKT